VGQGPRISRNALPPTPVRPASDTRIERMLASTRALEFVVHRTETEALLLEANLIKRLRPALQRVAARRQILPLHHLIAITSELLGPANPQASRRAHAAGGIITDRSLRSGRSTAPSTRYSGRFLCVHAAIPSSRVAPDRACSIKSNAARRLGTNEIDFNEYAIAGARGECVPLRAQRKCGQGTSLPARWRRASRALDFERRCRSTSGIAVRLRRSRPSRRHQGVNPRGVEEADVFALASAGRLCLRSRCSSSAPGQNWGNRAYFPRADQSISPGEILGAFLAQLLMTTSRARG